MTSDQEDSQDFKKFLALVGIEAVIVTALMAPNNPGSPWWLWGLLMLTPVGWVIPGIVLWLVNGLSSANRDEELRPRQLSSHGSPSDYSRLPSDWESALRHQSLDLSALYSLVDELYRNHGDRVCPTRKTVFRAFHLTPIASIEVVIVGQDPYANSSLADGLAFSQQGRPVPNTALHRIFMNQVSDPLIDAVMPSKGDLSEWARQGVFLVNRALTVLEGESGSHLAIWKSFCYKALRAVHENRPEAIYLCLGRPALDAVQSALPSSSQANIISTAHPMARDLDDSDLARFGNSRPFSDVNMRLLWRGRLPIRWELS